MQQATESNRVRENRIHTGTDFRQRIVFGPATRVHTALRSMDDEFGGLGGSLLAAQDVLEAVLQEVDALVRLTLTCSVPSSVYELRLDV